MTHCETKPILTAREYLEQAKYLDTRINAKIRQATALSELATNASSVLTGMPGNPNRGRSTMAEAVEKMLDMRAEINSDIDELVDLKREILRTISRVPSIEYQTILEKRYLCFESWDSIASEMQCELRWLYRLHGRALAEIQKLMPGYASLDQ